MRHSLRMTLQIAAAAAVFGAASLALSQAPSNRTGRGGRERGTTGPQRKGPAPAALKIGEALPDFSLEDIHGKKVRLSDFRGRIFALELGACT